MTIPADYALVAIRWASQSNLPNPCEVTFGVVASVVTDPADITEFVRGDMASSSLSDLWGAGSTALGGRANRGRMYFPGLPESAVYDDGGIVPTFQTTAQTAVDAFLAALAS